ncbi:uncharacterized protein LOC123674770 [Harmonia axyridis]|uniref:uncharacterized protein LOC123674770 n=1 Tax=Harmonia axyridis TaxID=115357 RepID=UPI001E276B36|nr:uncharacterized protein LOC123674770 [Harmonia axyridis]
MKLIVFTSILVMVQCLPQISNPRWHKNLQLEDNDSENKVQNVNLPATRNSPLKVPTESELEQNKNAHYSFNTKIDDKINDQTQQRSEVRKGLKVEGSYSYSDGYFKRTYEYVADDKGYRIVRSEVVPLQGPNVDLQGTASVDAAAHGTQLSYKVKSVPAVGPKIVEKFE